MPFSCRIFNPPRALYSSALCLLYPASPFVPALGSLAVPLAVASPVPHVASSISTAKSDFKYDKILGSPFLSLLGNHPAEALTALWGIMWQQITELRQVTMVRQVIEVTWQPLRSARWAKVARCPLLFFRSVNEHLLSSNKPDPLANAQKVRLHPEVLAPRWS